MINTTMTKKNVDFTTDNFEGDFIGFQAFFESIAVGLVLGFLFERLTLIHIN